MEVYAGVEKGNNIFVYPIKEFLSIARVRNSKAFFRRVLHHVKRSDM